MLVSHFTIEQGKNKILRVTTKSNEKWLCS